MVGVCQEKFKKIFPSWCVGWGLAQVLLAPHSNSNILILGREGERERAI